MLLAALAERATAFADARAQLRAGIFENGDGAEKETGEDGDGYGEEQDGAVDADLMNARQPVRRHNHERAQGAPGKPQTEQTAEQAEGEAFEPQFGSDASPTGA